MKIGRGEEAAWKRRGIAARSQYIRGLVPSINR
jgi:hypothetical protein